MKSGLGRSAVVVFAGSGFADEGHGVEFRCSLLSDHRTFGWVPDADYAQLRGPCGP